MFTTHFTRLIAKGGAYSKNDSKSNGDFQKGTWIERRPPKQGYV